MALLSEARFGVTDVPVTQPDNRLIPRADTTTAEAIQAFGDIGGQIREGMLKGELKNELEEAGNIISSINAGYPQLQKDIESGRINPDTEKFYRLSLAAEQGKISQQRAQLEAEVLLRSSIAKAPGFADEFRQTAREALGFDPSGAALNTLFLSGPDADSSRITQEQKDIEQAQAMVSGGAVANVQEGIRLINQARVAELRQTTTAAAIKNGTVSSAKVAVEGAQRVADSVAPIMIQAFTQIRETGGVQDIEALRSSVLATTQLQIRQLEREMSESTEFIYDPSAYQTARERMLEEGEAFVTLLENQDIATVLARRQDQLQSLADIGLHSVAPDLAVLAPLGEAAITSYLDLMVLSGGDPRKRQELINRDPRYAWIADVDMDNTQIAGSLKAIADKTLAGQIQTGEIDENTGIAALRAKATQAAAGDTTPEEFDSVVQQVFQVGRAREAISVIKDNPASHANMSAEGRALAAQNINNVSNQQIQTVAQGLANAGLELAFEKGKFVVVDPQQRNLSDVDPLSDLTNRFSVLPGLPGRENFVSLRLGAQAGVQENIDYLNNQLLPIMQNVQWANEAGFGNTEQWTRRVIGTSNSGLLVRPQAEVTEDSFIQYQGNPIVPGLSREEQAVAQFEGLHDPKARSWDGKTVGYGLDLDENPRAQEYIERFGLEGASNNEVAEFFLQNPQAATDVLQREVALHKQELSERWSPMNDLDEVRQEAMANLAYNLGVSKLFGFDIMLRGLETGDYSTAADNLVFNFKPDGTIDRPTKYLKDVGPRRAATLVYVLENGAWPTEQEVAVIERALAPFLSEG